MSQKKRERIVTSVGVAVIITSILYACALVSNQTTTSSPPSSAPSSPQAAVPPPTPVQTSSDFSIDHYTGNLDDPVNGLPEPGPPYGRENSSGDVVLKDFPRDAVGNVDFVKAFGAEEKTGPIYKMGKAIIKPHESLDLSKPGTPPFPFDIPIPAVGAMPDVIFPHFPHTFWLDCANCHPGIFIMKKGSNPISMVKIINGEFCGRCHGRVAFTLSNCTRCHVKPKG